MRKKRVRSQKDARRKFTTKNLGREEGSKNRGFRRRNNTAVCSGWENLNVKKREKAGGKWLRSCSGLCRFEEVRARGC